MNARTRVAARAMPRATLGQCRGQDSLGSKLVRIARGDYDDLICDGVSAAYKLAYNIVESVASRLRRMDEWIAELAGDHGIHELPRAEKLPEWRQFRNKLFNGWNL